MTDRAQNRFRPQLLTLESREQPGTLLAADGIDRVGSGVVAAADLIGDTVANKDTTTPFKGTADAVVTAAQPEADGLHLTLTESGQATHLGAFTRVENLVVHADGTITGTGTFTAANGDQLFTTVNGGFTSPTTVAGTYTSVGGTGRFADANATASFTGVTPDGIHVAVTFDGTLRNLHG